MMPTALRKRPAAENVEDLYQAQLDIFLDPNDPAVIEQARKDGVPEAGWRRRAIRRCGRWRWNGKSPSRCTPNIAPLPMVWYVPPLSPISAAANSGQISVNNNMPDIRSLRIPLKYLANLLTAGATEPVALCLERMLAMRGYMRSKTVEGVVDENIARAVGLTGAQIEDMYHVMAIANYEDRFVIPTGHREDAEDMYDERGSCGFSFGNGCSGGETKTNLFGAPARKKLQTPTEVF
jgi:nitrate reductase beta subunit